ncbi:hypothetical protein N7E81_06180 [Reichenbachiella carrageenanivorans]|uniref:DUF4468 domain-containing protein n=1 Tax=Reichenbachiella carrageenanivorans TaxID=2979869 RepID=A0ABY6D3D8_9BACT|nr:hypothetical protein [Reichenbachiella carrageenanivorans]UXX80684.1 hypothetical protein N7E81_06180 [Reichenbachiella carrageenanivorans]
MRTIFLSAALSLIFTLAHGQDQWLVTAQMDTIRGKIFLDHGGQYRVDEVRTKIGKEKNSYKCYQVRLVHLAKDEEFEVLKIDERYQFVKVVFKSKYFSEYLYVDNSNSGSNYSLRLLVNWQGEQFKFSNLVSKKRLGEYFSDCPAVSDQIESGELKKTELKKIFEVFDTCIDDQQKNSPKISKPVEVMPSANMESFISDVKAKDLYSDDLAMMIKDITQKLATQQTIPKYLQQAVIEQLGGDERLQAQFLKLVE